MAQMASNASVPNSETQSIDGYSRTTSIASEMRFKDNIRVLYERVQSALRHGRRREKRGLEISQPFNIKKELVLLPGVSQEELVILREKAAASRIGVAEDSMYSNPASVISRSRRARSLYERSPSPFSVASIHQQQPN